LVQCEDGKGWFLLDGLYESQLQAAKNDALKTPAGKKGSSGSGFQTVKSSGSGRAPGTSKGKAANNPYEMLFE
jgi:hypothetical protein